MNTHQPNPNILRYPGNYSIHDDKLRIENNKGTSSVLFEDISSISYKSVSGQNLQWAIIGFLVSILCTGIGASSNNIGIIVLGLITLIGFSVYSFIDKKQWDNVIIETRGGMLLFYSTEYGNGRNEVNRIEEEKRRITGKN